MTKEGDLAGYREELRRSGLYGVLAVFAGLIVLNILTFVIGPSQVLGALGNRTLGTFLSAFVFDTWGTVGGLVGVVVFFIPVLYGVQPGIRRRVSEVFLVSGVGIGYVVSAGWNLFYSQNQNPVAGSSAIAMAALGVVFVLSVFGLLRMRSGGPGVGLVAEERWYFAGVYLVVVASTLFFVLVLQPIFVPTDLYNWKAHEVAFLLSGCATALYGGYSFLARTAGRG
jgi:hypothetical protein